MLVNNVIAKESIHNGQRWKNLKVNVNVSAWPRDNIVKIILFDVLMGILRRYLWSKASETEQDKMKIYTIVCSGFEVLFPFYINFFLWQFVGCNLHALLTIQISYPNMNTWIDVSMLVEHVYTYDMRE